MHKLFIEINDTQFPIDTNSIVLDWFEKNKIANQFYVNYDNHKIIVKQNFFSPVLEVPNVCRYIIKKENDSTVRNLKPFRTLKTTGAKAAGFSFHERETKIYCRSYRPQTFKKAPPW